MKLIADLSTYLKMCTPEHREKRGVKLLSAALTEIGRLYEIADAACALGIARTEEDRQQATERLLQITDNYFAVLNGDNKKS